MASIRARCCMVYGVCEQCDAGLWVVRRHGGRRHGGRGEGRAKDPKVWTAPPSNSSAGEHPIAAKSKLRCGHYHGHASSYPSIGRCESVTVAVADHSCYSNLSSVQQPQVASKSAIQLY